MKFKISEIFYSAQGEGKYVGLSVKALVASLAKKSQKEKTLLNW